jgi:hypothetical protein
VSAAIAYRLSERVTAVQPNKFELVINAPARRRGSERHCVSVLEDQARCCAVRENAPISVR